MVRLQPEDEREFIDPMDLIPGNGPEEDQDTWLMKVCEVRKGDNIYADDTELMEHQKWETVVEVHMWLGNYEDPTKWVIHTLKPEFEWDWAKYPRYGEQDNDEYDGPPTIVPWDCKKEYRFTDWDHEIWVRNDNVEYLHPETLKPVRWWVSVYEVDRNYGGAEEGGWYYDSGEIKRNIPCKDYEEAKAVEELMREMFPRTGSSGSVLYSGGDYQVRTKGSPGKDYPEYRPHYS